MSSVNGSFPVDASEPVEIEIPVPWGHISGKDWGPKEGIPLLGLHGWQDNAGTFDLLAPYLPREYRLISIDLPGHGKSSHISPGMAYHYIDYVLTIKRVADHFHWRRFSILSHSMGSNLALMYASTYPEDVQALITLDTVFPRVRNPQDTAKHLRASYQQRLDIERKISEGSPEYSAEEALKRLLAATGGELSVEGARVLLKRGLKPSHSSSCNTYTFSRDLRLQAAQALSITKEQFAGLASQLSCDMLVIRAKPKDTGKRGFVIPFREERRRDENEMIAIYQRVCPRFQTLELEGTHFVHLNSPQLIGKLVSDFLVPTNARPHSNGGSSPAAILTSKV